MKQKLKATQTDTKMKQDITRCPLTGLKMVPAHHQLVVSQLLMPSPKLPKTQIPYVRCGGGGGGGGGCVFLACLKFSKFFFAKSMLFKVVLVEYKWSPYTMRDHKQSALTHAILCAVVTIVQIAICLSTDFIWDIYIARVTSITKVNLTLHWNNRTFQSVFCLMLRLFIGGWINLSTNFHIKYFCLKISRFHGP